MPRKIHSYWIAGRLCWKPVLNSWMNGGRFWTECSWVWNGEDSCACAVAGEHVWELDLEFSSGIPRNSVCVPNSKNTACSFHTIPWWIGIEEGTLGTLDFQTSDEETSVAPVCLRVKCTLRSLMLKLRILNLHIVKFNIKVVYFKVTYCEV